LTYKIITRQFTACRLTCPTIEQDPKQYPEKILEAAIDLLAIGVDPKKSILFVQSHVKEHTELTGFLNTLMPIAELERMTQYKDKAQQNKENVNVGLFTYPVLMAADILLYQAEVVPVGEDQLQHLELANMVGRNSTTVMVKLCAHQNRF
jgi:tryptophanyl-tRNA synthetase